MERLRICVNGQTRPDALARGRITPSGVEISTDQSDQPKLEAAGSWSKPVEPESWIVCVSAGGPK